MSSSGVRNAVCASCAEPLNGRFCSRCGEEALDRHMLTVGHFVAHTVLHEGLHVDGKIWRTLRALLFRPGFLSAEYSAGRRRPYINPVRLLITAIIVYAVATQGGVLFTLFIGNVNLSVAPTRIAKGSTVAETVARLDRFGLLQNLVAAKAASVNLESAPVRDEFHHKLDRFAQPLSFANVLLLAVALYVCFRRRRPLLVEHGVFSMHIVSFVLLSSLPLAAAMPLMDTHESVVMVLVLAIVLWQFIYLGTAVRRFYLTDATASRMRRGLIATAAAIYIYIMNSVFLTAAQTVGAALALWTLKDHV